MRIKPLIIVLIIWFNCNSLYSQEQHYQFNHRFIYKMTAQTDSTNQSKIVNNFWYLCTGDQYSLWQEEKSFRSDSILYHHNKERANRVEFTGIRLGPVNKFRHKIIKTSSEILVYDEVTGPEITGYIPLFQYQESKNSMKWDLEADTMRVGNLLCQKAVTNWGGRKWIAYFTPEIPISDGPFKFSGLPGLIVSIQDSQGYWRFDLMQSENLIPPKKVVINFQRAFVLEKGSKKDFFKIRKQYQNNFLNTYGSTAKKLSDEDVKRYKEMIAADNNWIELIP